MRNLKQSEPASSTFWGGKGQSQPINQPLNTVQRRRRLQEPMILVPNQINENAQASSVNKNSINNKFSNNVDVQSVPEQTHANDSRSWIKSTVKSSTNIQNKSENSDLADVEDTHSIDIDSSRSKGGASENSINPKPRTTQPSVVGVVLAGVSAVLGAIFISLTSNHSDEYDRKDHTHRHVDRHAGKDRSDVFNKSREKEKISENNIRNSHNKGEKNAKNGGKKEKKRENSEKVPDESEPEEDVEVRKRERLQDTTIPILWRSGHT